jgi:hypothetical protein
MTLEYTGSGSGKRYTIGSKIKVAEALLKGETSGASLSKEIGVSVNTLSIWKAEYLEGLYNIDNTNCIIRKDKTSLEVVLDKARKEAQEANNRVKSLEEAVAILQAAGVKVA